MEQNGSSMRKNHQMEQKLMSFCKYKSVTNTQRASTFPSFFRLLTCLLRAS